MGGGLRPRPQKSPHPAGDAPLDPACFWIEDSSGNRFVLNGISAKNLNIFFIEIFFFLTQHFFFSKSSELYPKKCSSKSDEFLFLIAEFECMS